MARKITTTAELTALVASAGVRGPVSLVLTRSGNVHVESAEIVEVREDGEFDVVYDDDGELVEATFDLCFYHVLAA